MSGIAPDTRHPARRTLGSHDALESAAAAANELPSDDPLIARLRAEITPREIRDTIARYSGAAPLGGTSSGRIASRHVAHRDNLRAVAQLVHDFAAIAGLAARPLPFWLDAVGGYRSNVEARLRTMAEREAVVLVTAHVDSTAKFESGYDPAISRAPGADDDASGMAAVLAIARAVGRWGAVADSACEIRFVLFNAEESNLAGSRRYAETWPADGPPLLAVVQLDMVGYRSRCLRDGRHPFEIHASASQCPSTTSWSLAIAHVIAAVAATVAPDLAPHVYPGDLQLDPAYGRSDHSSFHRRDVGAVVISENVHRGPDASSPPPSPNAGYHRYTDTVDAIDATYAASIARVTAAAVVLMARSYRGARD